MLIDGWCGMSRAAARRVQSHVACGTRVPMAMHGMSCACASLRCACACACACASLRPAVEELPTPPPAAGALSPPSASSPMSTLSREPLMLTCDAGRRGRRHGGCRMPVGTRELEPCRGVPHAHAHVPTFFFFRWAQMPANSSAGIRDSSSFNGFGGTAPRAPGVAGGGHSN